MNSYEKLLLKNKAWAAEKVLSDPHYFERLAEKQTPDFLWIGCSDSRVPAELTVNAAPGDIFMHRNIANQAMSTDFNSLSVLQYAVEVLKVSQVIVCGHYQCEGIKTALAKQDFKLAITNKWLAHIKDLYCLHQHNLEVLPNEESRLQRFVEINVIEQVKRLMHSSIIQNAWNREQRPKLRGCIYQPDSGVMQEIITIEPGSYIEPNYQYDFV